MEFRSGLGLARVLPGLPKRIRDLSQGPLRGPLAASLKRHRRALQGVLCLAAAAALGSWAQDQARSEALSGWLRSHPPSPSLWKHALESHGLRPALGQAYAKAQRTLPSLVEEDGRAWATPDSNWIALYFRGEKEPSPQLFCLECGRPPASWAPVGNGWEAFDPVLADVDRAVKARAGRASVRSPRKARDPREIIY